MKAPLAPELVKRMLDQMILDRVRMAIGPDDLPELEEDLIGLLDEIHRPGDPPSKDVAVHLVLAALRAHDDETGWIDQALGRARGAAS